MKKKRIIPIGIVLIIALFSACVENQHEMLTTINADGSCSREFKEKADSAFMVDDTAKSNPFPFDLDATWIISWSYDSINKSTHWPLNKWEQKNKEDKEKVFVYAQKAFPSVDSMASFDYLTRGTWKPFRTYLAFERNFRWFYTYHSFKETFPKYDPDMFNHVPITKYLTEKEAKFWFQGKYAYYLKGMNGVEIIDHLEHMNKKVDQWIGRNVFEECIHVIANHAELLDAPGIDAQRLLSDKDSIYESYEKKKELSELEFDIKALDNYYQTKAFSKMMDKQGVIDDKLDSSLVSNTGYLNTEIDYHLDMPGKILSTNGSTENSNTLYWKVDAYRFSLFDYEMYAESRTPNVWAFIVSGLFVVLAVGIFFIPAKRPGRRR